VYLRTTATCMVLVSCPSYFSTTSLLTHIDSHSDQWKDACYYDFFQTWLSAVTLHCYYLTQYDPRVKLIPRRAECLWIFPPPLYLIDELRSLISKEFPSSGCLGLKPKTRRHSTFCGMSVTPLFYDMVKYIITWYI
jgi:hypothetical protein